MNRQRWLLVSNCQTEGLAKSLEALCAEVEVERAWVHQAANDPPDFDSYDRVLIHHDHCRIAGIDLRERAGTLIVPGIQFGAYHPDIGYFMDRRGDTPKRVNSPLVEYQSMLVIAAYKRGMTAAEAERLFNAEVYRTAGYLDLWAAEKKLLGRALDAAGLNVADFLPRWAAREPFMYSINHPRIGCLHDIARAMLSKAEMPIRDYHVLPVDGLAWGPAWPVYPEIAERHGVPGSYYFKPVREVRSLTLREFIEQSFAMIAPVSPDDLVPMPMFAKRFERVLDAV